MKTNRSSVTADGRDMAVVTIEVQDPKGRIVPNACPMLTLTLEGEGRILGVGNGDPCYLGEDHPKESDCKSFQIPAFNGLAQVLIQSNQQAGQLLLNCKAEQLKAGFVTVQSIAAP
jgi:beta-galactosidase